jgi:hypothetical protein
LPNSILKKAFLIRHPDRRRLQDEDVIAALSRRVGEAIGRDRLALWRKMREKLLGWVISLKRKSVEKPSNSGVFHFALSNLRPRFLS